MSKLLVLCLSVAAAFAGCVGDDPEGSAPVTGLEAGGTSQQGSRVAGDETKAGSSGADVVTLTGESWTLVAANTAARPFSPEHRDATFDLPRAAPLNATVVARLHPTLSYAGVYLDRGMEILLLDDAGNVLAEAAGGDGQGVLTFDVPGSAFGPNTQVFARALPRESMVGVNFAAEVALTLTYAAT